jgi:hypothetical protein
LKQRKLPLAGLPFNLDSDHPCIFTLAASRERPFPS